MAQNSNKEFRSITSLIVACYFLYAAAISVACIYCFTLLFNNLFSGVAVGIIFFVISWIILILSINAFIKVGDKKSGKQKANK